MSGLFSDSREKRAHFFGFDNANGLAVDEQKIITCAGFERGFPQSNASCGRGIELLVILHQPARRDELRIDLLASQLFRVKVRHKKAK